MLKEGTFKNAEPTNRHCKHRGRPSHTASRPRLAGGTGGDSNGERWPQIGLQYYIVPCTETKTIQPHVEGFALQVNWQ